MSKFIRRAFMALALERWSSRLEIRLPRGVGTAATAFVMLATLAYGAVEGDHLSAVVAAVIAAHRLSPA